MNDFLPKLDPVLEISDTAGFGLWPVTAPPAGGFLALSGELTAVEVGTALAVLATYNDERAGAGAEDAEELIRRLVEAECIIAQGGIRVRDPGTNSTLDPGCCFGLESWRDWLALADGETPWLGHSPQTRVEHRGPVVRLWSAEQSTEQSTERSREQSTEPSTEPPHTPPRPVDLPVDLPVAELPGLLAGVQGELRGFLRQVERWADTYAPSYAVSLVTRIDEELGVEGPLGR